MLRTTNPKILRRLERILLRGFLCALRVLAVNAGQHFHREDAKDAEKTLRRPFSCGLAALCHFRDPVVSQVESTGCSRR